LDEKTPTNVGMAGGSATEGVCRMADVAKVAEVGCQTVKMQNPAAPAVKREAEEDWDNRKSL
jgi:hypothetical protein